MILLYFMDGLKYEMAEKYMPFLSSLNKKPLKSEFGYSCACHATMYTGRYIDEHNTWFVWKKGDDSPYKWINKVPLLKYFNFIPVKVLVSKFTRKIKKNSSFPGIPMLVNLPLKYWGEFQPCEDTFWSSDDYLPEYRTLFKELRSNGIAHKLVGLSKNGDVFAEEKSVDYNKEEFVYFFIGDVDSYMHKYGENAEESINYLKKTDEFIKETYEKAKNTNKPITVICYSDHGHIDVEKKIDINDYFKPYGLDVKKYLQLTESTFIRFWFRDDKERAEVMQVLSEMQEKGLGFVIDDEMKEKYHLKFNSNEHGDVVFHLSAPNIFTNTIWGFGKTIASMHGYYPELEKHYGIFASDKKITDRDFVYLTDIFPTLLSELGIENDDTIHGDAILTAEDSKNE